MSDLDHGIEMLTNLVRTFEEQGDNINARQTRAELNGWLEVKQGLPRNESKYCHVNEVYAYAQGRHAAACWLGKGKDERP